MKTNKMELLKKHIHIGSAVMVAMLVTTMLYVISFALPPPPDCEGVPATIWVDGTNMVQPDNVPYTGTLTGTTGNDIMVGTNGVDIINGLDGDDIICALDDNDQINGGNGNDLINGGKNKDTIDGGRGDDTIKGKGGADTIKGGSGNDTIKGQGGKDIICSGPGNDDIEGGNKDDKIDADGDNDTIDGGNGSDICLNGDVSTTNCEDTTTLIVECIGTSGSAGSSSGRWQRCNGKRIPYEQYCNGEVTQDEITVVADDDDDDDDVEAEEVKVCYSFDLEKQMPEDISEFVYFYKNALALYYTSLVNSYYSEDDVYLMPNTFITRLEALQIALDVNCYPLDEDVWAQGVEMELVDEESDPDERITVEEGRSMFALAAGIEVSDYDPENYIPGNKLLRRDAMGMVTELIPLSNNVDEISKQEFQTLLENL